MCFTAAFKVELVPCVMRIEGLPGDEGATLRRMMYGDCEAQLEIRQIDAGRFLKALEVFRSKPAAEQNAPTKKRKHAEMEGEDSQEDQEEDDEEEEDLMDKEPGGPNAPKLRQFTTQQLATIGARSTLFGTDCTSGPVLFFNHPQRIAELTQPSYRRERRTGNDGQCRVRE
jgi:hypothetical protein